MNMLKSNESEKDMKGGGRDLTSGTTRHLSGETKSVSVPWLEFEISRIRRKGGNHSTTKFISVSIVQHLLNSL
jgi:hypothetical protein